MRIKFFDGSMGTMLQSAGLEAGELPELWNLTNKEKVLEIHNAYAQAGSEFITTNTFGANRLKFDNADKLSRQALPLRKAQAKGLRLTLAQQASF